MLSKKKKVGLLILSAVVLIAVLSGVYFLTRNQADNQTKTITVEVVFSDTERKEHSIKTSEEYLRGALEQEKLIEGEESQYGLFVITVDGATADASKQQWWCFTKNGETLMEGVDTIPIADQEHYEITLKTGF
ncbi:MAG: DUF4430 domain-containing protein [Christensenellales bacterium]